MVGPEGDIPHLLRKVSGETGADLIIDDEWNGVGYGEVGEDREILVVDSRPPMECDEGAYGAVKLPINFVPSLAWLSSGWNDEVNFAFDDLGLSHGH